MSPCGQVVNTDQRIELSRTGATTEEAVLRCLLRRYRPLATAVLDVVCEYAPSRITAASLSHRPLG